MVGSPRVNGNTELLVKHALKVVAENGLETELISLREKVIKPCNACMECRRTGKCPINDDFEEVFHKIQESQGIILASPVYFGSITPELKALIDRVGYFARVKGNLLRGRVGGPIIVARRGGAVYALTQLLLFFYIMEIIVPGSNYWTIAFGRERGEALTDVEGLDSVTRLAENISNLIKKLF